MTDINQKLFLTSNVLEQNIKSYEIILFVDELQNIWYLKCSSALYHENKPALIKDPYVDTTHLYKIKEEDYDYIVNKYNHKFILVEDLHIGNINKIYQNVISNFNREPSNINIIDVSVNRNDDKINFHILYTNQTTLDSEINLFKLRNKNDKDYQTKLQSIISLKDDIINRSMRFSKSLESILGFINNYYSQTLYDRMIIEDPFTL